MSHGNTIVDGYRIELCGITAHLLYLFTNNLTYLMQMCVTGHKLGERIDNSNNRLAKLLMFHTCGNPQRTGSSHSATFRTYSTSQWILHICLVPFYRF